ncbi:hypothetical protein ACHAXR_012603, partial [Thalassiosira sp. AJA248-18]
HCNSNRRYTSLFNAALETEVSEAKRKYTNTSSNNSTNNENLEPNSNEANDPTCRVVATSDGKISPLPAISSLSSSSKSLLEKIELLYTVQSQKELRDLAYMLPRSADKKAYRDELSYDAIENTEGGTTGVLPRVMSSGTEQEEKLVSILKQSLEDGGFKLMDQRDRDLCSALNAGYLLRLSLLPDTKELDPCIGKEFYPEFYEENENEVNGRKDGKKRDKDIITSNNKLLFDGRVLIFRRGYSEEISTGRLLLPKLDYLQASIVQRSTTAVTSRLGAFERRLEDFILAICSKLNSSVQSAYRQILQQCRAFTVGVLENFGLSENELVSGFISKNAEMQSNKTSDGEIDKSQSKTSSSSSVYNVRGNKIFKLGRYRTSTSANIIPNPLDLNDALAPFLLCETGANIKNTVEQDMYDGLDTGKILCQYDDALYSLLNATSEDRTPLPFLHKPAAVRLLERVSIQNTVDFSSKIRRRELVKNYFKSSTLVEPAYEEVIVIWRPLRKKKPKTIQQIYPPKWLYEVAKVFDMEDRLPKRKNNTREDTFDDSPVPLEIKAFYDVPMANIEAVLPKTKLVFRPADAIVFDLVSVVSFLAVAGSLKFDSARLDLIALVSLVFFAVRTFFRYSNKYARYDLLVNKFLTSKISHRGPGALKYIVSEANSNKALRAMLIRDWLSKGEIHSSISGGQLDEAVLEQGKAFEHIDFDILAALEDLENLQLTDQYNVKEDQDAQDTIKQLWNEALDR